MELEFTNSWSQLPCLSYSPLPPISLKGGLLDSLQTKSAKGREDSISRFHIAVEGAPAAGKTRFIRSLIGADGKGTDYAPTHGVAVHQLAVPVEYKGEKRICCLSLWEYGSYFARKFEYVQESVGRDQHATIHVLSILDRTGFQELLERRDSHYSCVFLSKTDLCMQTNVFPNELPQLARDFFVDSRLLLTHLCGKLLERQEG